MSDFHSPDELEALRNHKKEEKQIALINLFKEYLVERIERFLDYGENHPDDSITNGLFSFSLARDEILFHDSQGTLHALKGKEGIEAMKAVLNQEYGFVLNGITDQMGQKIPQKLYPSAQLPGAQLDVRYK